MVTSTPLRCSERSIEQPRLWRDPVRGVLSPLAVVPVAEANDLIEELTLEIFRSAVALQAQWQATALAARSLDADLGQSLEQVLREALKVLEQRPFAQRLRDARLR